MPAPTKAELRAGLNAARRARDDASIARSRTAIAATVLRVQAVHGWRCVAAYQPMRTEPGSVEMLAALRGAGIRVLVPVTLADLDLDWSEWPGATEPLGPPLGRDAISDADAVLVPALAVDSEGVRLGRGGGCYDRALGRARPGAVIVALLFDDELREALPHDPWDRAVSAVVTPAGWTDLPTPG